MLTTRNLRKTLQLKDYSSQSPDAGTDEYRPLPYEPLARSLRASSNRRSHRPRAHRLELDHYGDLFAALSRFRQRGRDWGSTTGPIERLLDGQNIRIFCRLFNEIEHRLKAFIRMMQQDRFPSDL